MTGNLIGIFLLLGCATSETTTDLTLEEVRVEAKELYDAFAKKNPDQLEIGPCLGVIGQWAIDIAHSPRESVDNELENQCDQFQTGQVERLLEFSPRGQIITIK